MENKQADVLANLAVALMVLDDVSLSISLCRRWAEAIDLGEAKKESVVDFIRTHIIYRYDIPYQTVTDNGRQFSNSLMDRLCEKFKFKQYKSSIDWQEKIGEALWAYRTTHHTPIGVTSYSLVYGVEDVLSLEREIPPPRMTIQEELTIEDNAKLRLQELEALDEK
ncbi:uncharacterized protein LOC120078002 [Benincasa hispida]|uniref:uncharacterized protein LOC120078002 n=1 Tax=Benincasa hispida TaxID=102211 RepID=UPI00190109EB|nr:uncharacterized protein LOC120078002 [Benincasa hispida]